MSLFKRLPFIFSMAGIATLILAIHIGIFTFSFYEGFEWFNNWLLDNTYEDPLIFLWLFWIVESLVVLMIFGKKVVAGMFH